MFGRARRTRRAESLEGRGALGGTNRQNSVRWIRADEGLSAVVDQAKRSFRLAKFAICFFLSFLLQEEGYGTNMYAESELALHRVSIARRRATNNAPPAAPAAVRTDGHIHVMSCTQRSPTAARSVAGQLQMELYLADSRLGQARSLRTGTAPTDVQRVQHAARTLERVQAVPNGAAGPTFGESSPSSVAIAICRRRCEERQSAAAEHAEPAAAEPAEEGRSRGAGATVCACQGAERWSGGKVRCVNVWAVWAGRAGM